MNLSSIVVVVPPDHLAAALEQLTALPGVEVHYVEERTGRIVVIQEAATVDGEQQGLRRIQGLPRVIQAEMSYHYFADDE